MKTSTFLINGRTKCEILHYKELESTNKHLKAIADEGAPSWTVVIADGQTGGYGRYGRAFDSEINCGLYMSILLRADVSFDPMKLTPTAAVATAVPLEKISGKTVKIKWVNDLLIDNLKVCGILTEASSDSGRLNYAVVGIGVNLGGRENGFSNELKGIAGTVFDDYSENTRDDLVRMILSYLEDYLYCDDERVYSEYSSRLAYVGDAVSVIKADKSTDATVLGVESDFSLSVRYNDGSLDKLFSGEISIKRK